ncbi:putative Zn(II)2Cys6 transcription factor [Aspergillus ambiguus]|uniref:Zn(II)2Cys6 transcription factor n=1 Tax=Aspergillus ambiguus TaxID=176160 RepID=UPI003CCD9C1A
MTPKRERTVQGSCWPCKQRRVKCDLLRPRCRRCVLSGGKCSYDKILVRWNARPTKGAPLAYQLPNAGFMGSLSVDGHVAATHRKALEYFQAAFWPLMSTAARPCPPPIGLAMESQPVLLVMCELADAHRAVLLNKEKLALDKRLSCLASVREQLRHSVSNTESLSRLLVAVLLLYFLDGYIDCTEQSASTASHKAGVQAMVEQLGGLTALLDNGQSNMSMLMSEFATTDLTRSLLDDRLPCFPADIWTRIESSTVWWEKQKYGGMTMGSVFGIMAAMASYRQSVQTDGMEPSIERIQEFERSLQPTFFTLDLEHLRTPDPYIVEESDADQAMQTVAFTRAFQHSALIYLYRAVCGLPARHCLVQQHVQSCFTCIMGISSQSKAHNCIIFPLYVSGAHSFGAEQQSFVLRKIDEIYQTLRFASLLSIRAALEDLWASAAHDGRWSDMFTFLRPGVLVL